MKNNMPTQPVHDLVIHPREKDLVVATHGRGIFIADISPLAELTAEVLAGDVYLFPVESKIRWINNKRNASSSLNYDGKSEPNGLVIYYYLKQKAEGDAKVTVYKGNMVINEIRGKKAAGIHKVLWNMTQRRERTEEEKKRIRERMKRYAAYGFRRQMDENYAYSPAPLGEYRIVLTVDGQKYTRYASINKDHWYDK
jgi:hypothetical protein